MVVVEAEEAEVVEEELVELVSVFEIQLTHRCYHLFWTSTA